MIGKTLSHYEIESEIGRGRMGIATYSSQKDREIRVEFNFVERLKDTVPPIEYAKRHGRIIFPHVVCSVNPRNPYKGFPSHTSSTLLHWAIRP